jgi:choline kinase
MAKLRAAVLAAGRNVPLGGDAPASLKPVGEKPLLHYTLLGLRKAGIDDVLVVTGFKPAGVEEFVTENWGGEVAFVFNARYASWGSFHSVRMAIDQSPGMDVMVVDSDVVVHPDVLGRVAGAPGDLVIAVERRHRFDTEDMRVTLSGNRVRAMGKGIKQAHTQGEFVGASLIRPAAARLYADLATDQQWHARTNIPYEDVYNLVLGGVDGRSVDVQGGEYAKVVGPEDVPAATLVLERHAGAWGQTSNAGKNVGAGAG